MVTERGTTPSTTDGHRSPLQALRRAAPTTLRSGPVARCSSGEASRNRPRSIFSTPGSMTVTHTFPGRTRGHRSIVSEHLRRGRTIRLSGQVSRCLFGEETVPTGHWATAQPTMHIRMCGRRSRQRERLRRQRRQDCSQTRW